MLVLTRKAGEKIVIGDEIVVTILDVRGDGIRIGIDAPRGVKIQREEVLIAVAEANMSAALVDDGGAEQIKNALGLGSTAPAAATPVPTVAATDGPELPESAQPATPPLERDAE